MKRTSTFKRKKLLGDDLETIDSLAEKKLFVRTLQYLAKECNKELNRTHFRVYGLAIQAVGFEWGIKAVEKYILSRRDRDAMPTPRELLSMALQLKDDNEDPSNPEEIASRIVGAVRKFGRVNPEDARKYIGEVGWQIVKSEGGWSVLCESLNDYNLTQNRNHWSKLAMALIERRAEAMVQSALKAGPKRLLSDPTKDR